VAEWREQEALVAAVLDAYGRIDVAFANAGFGGGSSFLDGDPEHMRGMVLTNVYGAALTIRATIPALRESRGHLLLTGSVAGRIARSGSLYSCTKHAVTAMAEAARLELNDSGVRVTLLSPGAVDTPFWGSDGMAGVLAAEEIADAILYAVSRPPHIDMNEILVRPTVQSN
jgi:NADP-dependent 3-hydroxy acid dehydrogenase YdfG